MSVLSCSCALKDPRLGIRTFVQLGAQWRGGFPSTPPESPIATIARVACDRATWTRCAGRSQRRLLRRQEPIAVTVRGADRWVPIHRCTNCGRLRLNKTACDEPGVPDIPQRRLAFELFTYGV
ncbi:RNHCP domain-containing protein [Kribbella swartbergensis]